MSTRLSPTAVSRRMALAGLGIGGLGLGLTTTRTVTAQDASPEMTTHPIIGAWFQQNDPNNPADVDYVVFHGDGTYNGVHPIAGPTIGVWQPTDEGRVDLTVKAVNISFDAGKYVAGTVHEWYTLTVDGDGMTYAGPYAVELTSPDGTHVAGFESTTSATRLTVETMAQRGTPTP
jgi:hypothetical protein